MNVNDPFKMPEVVAPLEIGPVIPGGGDLVIGSGEEGGGGGGTGGGGGDHEINP